MNGLMTFLSIIMIVFGILQIILFFKMWKMTNSVESIKSIILDKTAEIDLVQGDKEQIAKLLKKQFSLEIIDIFNTINDSYRSKESLQAESNSKFAIIAEDYNSKAKDLGLDGLDFNNNLDSLFEKLFMFLPARL